MPRQNPSRLRSSGTWPGLRFTSPPVSRKFVGTGEDPWPVTEMADPRFEARSPRSAQHSRNLLDSTRRGLDGLVAHLVEDASEPRRRKLRLRLLAEDSLGRHVAVLQGYLAMLHDGTLDDPEPIFPILLGHAHDLVIAIEDLIRHQEEGGL